MRSLSVPALVLITSLFLVGFTIVPQRLTSPITRDQLASGPVVVACRAPSLFGVDRICWWAWNPHRRAIHLASPEEGWGEVEASHIVWSSQIEDIPSKAWQQLQGIVPIPSLIAIEPGQVAAGTFIADLPSTELDATRSRADGSDGLPVVLRLGWFERPLPARPTSLSDYQSLVAGQSLALSNPLLGITSATDLAREPAGESGADSF